LKEIATISWERFKIITGIIGDVQGRLIAILFYFTILVPFGIASRLLSDPLNIKRTASSTAWLERHPASREIEAAQRQG
jgi:hypothetical protein